MKKSIKRFLVLAQVLGVGAIAASACTSKKEEPSNPYQKAAECQKITDPTKGGQCLVELGKEINKDLKIPTNYGQSDDGGGTING